MNFNDLSRWAIARLLATVALVVGASAVLAAPQDIVVKNDADSGPGSLRAALEEAASLSNQPVRIVLSGEQAAFSQPRVIELSAPLAPISGEVEIHGFLPDLLWKAYGVTISGSSRHRIFEIRPEGSLTLDGITLRNAHADTGGAILNRGSLLVKSTSLLENRAEVGGAIANFGTAVVINSTLAFNEAKRGGAISNGEGSRLSLVHATLSANAAPRGAAIWSKGAVSIANSILAGASAQQCYNVGHLDAGSRNNLIEGTSVGCGTPLLNEDPRFEPLGYFNGPTPTIPVNATSPVLNLGDPDAARDEMGQRLQWDQRGNGDPRFAAGYPDLGAFERQGPLPSHFIVDTKTDNGLRGCTLGGPGNCPLRAALELAAVARHATPIRFDPAIFDEPQTIVLAEPPEGTNASLLIDGQGAAPVTIELENGVAPWEGINGVTILDARSGPDDGR